jgi:glutamate-5-semialdehyde dehydrogenase
MDGTMRDVAVRARAAYLELLGCSTDDKNEALRAVIRSLKRQEAEIAEANRGDLKRADDLVASGEMRPALRARLVFDDKKLRGVIAGVEDVIGLPDPAGRVEWRRELDAGLILSRVSCPLGVVGVIFESRPDVVVQVSSLILKAGNAGILKGGKEAQETNQALMAAIRDGLETAGSVPVDALQLVSTREEVTALLDSDDAIDLLIPRGSKEMVRYIQEHTRIPVLGHTDGVCHVYVHEEADPAVAVAVAVDAKTEYPAVCNAAETILVDQGVAGEVVPSLVAALKEKNVEVRGCSASRALAPDIGEAGEEAWAAEYLDLVVNLRVVPGLKEAVEHVNRYGSHHTDAIVTTDEDAASYFCRYVDSAGVFVNCSTRFADGFRYGLGAEIGISTNKIHARGPVGLEGIVTYKYELHGRGHIVADYSAGKRKFTHRRL